MRFHKGSKRVGFKNNCVDNSINLVVKKLDSFLSYQLVKADLLVCMTALGDRIKVGFGETDETLHAFVLF